jgi:heme exporter protein CcmD
MSDFIYEGGYAAYVWSAYAISALSLALLGAWTVTNYRKAKVKIDRLGGYDRHSP